MKVVQLGVVVTVILAVISGIYFIGSLDGRLTAIENDKDYQSFKIEKQKAFAAIESERDAAVNKLISIKKLNQDNCRIIDSAARGVKLKCRVGEFVAGAKYAGGSRTALDMLTCCTP
ncbi:MAG: hypothetical protein AAFP10_07010 [Pseudomonadota bacterium]